MAKKKAKKQPRKHVQEARSCEEGTPAVTTAKKGRILEHKLLLRLIFFGGDVSYIAGHIADGAWASIDNLRKANFTRKQLLDDLGYILDQVKRAQKRAIRIMYNYVHPFADIAKESWMVLDIIHSVINREYLNMSWRKPKKEVALTYFSRAYHRANEHGVELLKLIARLNVEMGGEDHLVEKGFLIPDKDREITLKEFLRKFCRRRDNVIDADLARLRRARQEIKIKLPKEVRPWKPGQSKYYLIEDLLTNWKSYCDKVEHLPRIVRT